MATTGRPLVAGLLGIGLMASACGGGSVETGVDGGLALDQDADFVNVIFSDGTERDCDERQFDAPPAVVFVPGR